MKFQNWGGLEVFEQTLKTMSRLGRTEYEVFPLGLGGHTYPVGNDQASFRTYDQRAQLVHHLVSQGVNYFDTTWLNEVELLADSFKRAGIKNKNNMFVSLQYVDGISDSLWRKKLREELESRLRIMDYDFAPLFIMGVGNQDITLQEFISACEAMGKLKAEGLIKHIGIACHRIEYFPFVSKAIREYNLLDYMMIRFNWKYQQANDELFKVAKEHDVGVVLMKAFCWDCGPGQWGRRISVFEPVEKVEMITENQRLTPAQRSLIWSLQNSPGSVAVISMNTMWEAEQNLNAMKHLHASIDTIDLDMYSNRLWNRDELYKLSIAAESNTIREQACRLLGSL
jgi:predicted aldo/keto reductase-like oxidoreductase